MPSRGGKEVVNPQEAEGQEAREVMIQGGKGQWLSWGQAGYGGTC